MGKVIELDSKVISVLSTLALFRLSGRHGGLFLMINNRLFFFGNSMRSLDSNLRIKLRNFASWNLVDILHVTTKISALSECFRTPRALKWSLTCVLSEMIPKVATFLKDAIAALVLALEE